MRPYEIRRTQHIVETRPNKQLDGYYHLSSAGPYRSTLVRYVGKPDGLSARQRRKKQKAERREARAVHDHYTVHDGDLR